MVLVMQDEHPLVQHLGLQTFESLDDLKILFGGREKTFASFGPQKVFADVVLIVAFAR